MQVKKTEASTCSKNKSKSCKKEKSPCDNTTGTSNSGASNPFASCSQCHYIGCSKFICPETIDSDITSETSNFNEPVADGYMAEC